MQETYFVKTRDGHFIIAIDFFKNKLDARDTASDLQQTGRRIEITELKQHFKPLPATEFKVCS